MGVNKNDGGGPFAMRSLRFLRASRASRRYANGVKEKSRSLAPKCGARHDNTLPNLAGSAAEKRGLAL